MPTRETAKAGGSNLNTVIACNVHRSGWGHLLLPLSPAGRRPASQRHRTDRRSSPTVVGSRPRRMYSHTFVDRKSVV